MPNFQILIHNGFILAFNKHPLIKRKHARAKNAKFMNKILEKL